MNNKNSNIHILVMCLADPSGDPRPRRVIELCNKMGYSVSVASHPIKGDLDIYEHFEIPVLQIHGFTRFIRWIKTGLLLFTAYVLKYKKFYVLCNNMRYGLLGLSNKIKSNYNAVIVEDLQLLPLAFQIRSNGKILFDAREYYPRQKEDEFKFHIFEKPIRTWLCNEYLKKCDRIITVSNGLAKEYKKEFDVTMQVIRSTPNYTDFSVKPCDKSVIRMVHHGGANRNRKIERMIELMNLLDDRFTLDLYLTKNHTYINWLKAKAKKNKRVRFCDPVPYSDILPMLNKYDIGLYLLQPTGFNTTYCLPNKLFEYIQARLAVAIGPSPDMSEIVDAYQCGIVSPNFNPEAMAECLSRLTLDDIDQMKQNSDKAAKELCFEEESKKLSSIIAEFLNNN